MFGKSGNDPQPAKDEPLFKNEEIKPHDESSSKEENRK